MNVAKIVSLYISRGGLVERDPKNSNDRKKSSSRSLRVRRPQIKKKKNRLMKVKPISPKKEIAKKG